MAEQEITLEPNESRVVTFEATPHEARTYQVSVDGLYGSFVAIAVPKGAVVGVIYDSRTDAPIAGVTVKAMGPLPSTISRTTTTASDGSYSLSDLEAGTYDVEFSKPNYETLYLYVDVYAGETTEFNITMLKILT